MTRVKGTVVSEGNNEPVTGVSVMLKGSHLGVCTDIHGRFVIDVPANAKTLVFSFIGMQTQEAEISPYMHIVMHDEVQELEEVIIHVAYGRAKKSSLTGAITVVPEDKIKNRPVSNVIAVLEGNVPGIQLNNTLGQPGTGPGPRPRGISSTQEIPDIRIRGIGTVNGSASPLYIIDGVPFEGSLSDLNPADIESLSVLKDAASCALYGNRGANGVILITTKRGKTDRISFEIHINQGIYTRGTKEYKRTDPYQFMEAMWQNMKNQYMTKNRKDEATAAAYASSQLIPDVLKLNIFNKTDDKLFDAGGHLTSGTKILPGYAGDLDWFDAALDNGYRQEYTLSGSKASDNSDIYLSLGYLDENGYARNAGFNRLSARISANLRPVPWLKTGLNLSGTHQLTHSMQGNGQNENAYINVFKFAREIAPIYPVHLHNPDGSFRLNENGGKQYDSGTYTNDAGQIINTRSQFAGRHVIWENELDTDKTYRNTLHTIVYADIRFLKDFTFTVKGNLQTENSENQTYNNAIIGDGQGNKGRTQRLRLRSKTYTFQQQLNWTHNYSGHLVDIFLAHENSYYNYNYEYARKSTEVFTGQTHLSNFTEIGDLTGYDNNLRSESYLGCIRYSYNGKYNAELSFRRDGSSRFSRNNRWGTFGSAGANWLISREDFMQKQSWMNSLKLRANWGLAGSDAGAGYYGYMDLFLADQNANAGAYYRSQHANEELKWETGESWSIAIESRLFNRWNLSIEYFDKRNKDLLFDVYQPLSAGGTTTTTSPAATITQNIGTIANRGIEITTDADIYRRGKWMINCSMNISFIKNKVLKLPVQNKNGISDNYTKIVEGKSRYEFFMPTFAGVDRLTGNSMYIADLETNYIQTDKGITGNRNGADITAQVTRIGDSYYVNNTTYALKKFQGSALPKVSGSFGLHIARASLRISGLFTYALGGKTYDGVYQNLMSTSSEAKNLHSDIMKSWRQAPEGMTESSAGRLDPDGIPVINYDKSSNNNAISSRWLTKSDYLVLKNLSLNYSLPQTWVNRLELQGIDIRISCENLFTLTARQGMNPQQSFSGMQNNYIVIPRIFSAGLSLKL